MGVIVAKRKSKPVQSNSRTPIVITLLIAALLNYALYSRALFNAGLPSFDGPILLACVLTLLLGLAFGVHFIRLKEKPAVWPLLLIWLIPLTVAVSWFGAVSRHGASMSVIMHVVYALLFVFGYVVMRSETYRRYAVLTVMFSGHVVVLFGFVNWLGLNIYTDAVNAFSGEYRLMSVFQYANTYGAFLIALALASLYLLIHSGSRFVRFVSAAMLPLILISLVLTLSRGAWLAFPVLFVFVLLFIKPSRQVLFLLYAIAAGIPALAVLGLAYRCGIEQQSAFTFGRFFLGAGLLIIASAVSAVIGHLISRYVEPGLAKWAERESKRTASLWLPLGSVAAAAGLGFLFLKTNLVTLLPDNIAQRVSGINFAQHSVLERFSFYADALRISRDYPVLGAGGGAWNVLYEQYQSYPYLSTQVHSFALQHLVETGWIGMLVLIAIFALILVHDMVRTFRSGTDETFVFFILAVSLVAHSLIDFNFSYMVVGAIVYFSLGVLAQRLPQWTFRREQSTANLYSWGMFAVILTVLFASITAYNGHLYYVKTSELMSGGQATDRELTAAANRTIQRSKQFAHFQNYFEIETFLYDQTGNPDHLDGIRQAVAFMEKYEPERRATFVSRYLLYLKEGNQSEAVRFLLDGTDKYPWDLEIYTEAFYQLFNLGVLQPSHWDQALALFEKMKAKMVQIEQLPSYMVQSKDFRITEDIATIVGKIHYLKQDYASAYETILRYLNPQPGFSADEPESIRTFLGL